MLAMTLDPDLAHHHHGVVRPVVHGVDHHEEEVYRGVHEVVHRQDHPLQDDDMMRDEMDMTTRSGLTLWTH